MKIRKQIFSIFISACLVVGMLPAVSFAAEADGIDTSGLCEHHTVHDEACGYVEGSEGSPCTHEHGAECGTEGADCTHEHDENCGYVPAVEGHPCTYVCELCGLTEITAWSWVDELGAVDPSSGILALSGAESPVLYDEIADMLPAQITAATENGTETLTLGGWTCDNYPGEGANTGSYLFTAALPEGYALAENVPVLTVTVAFGGVAVQDGEHSDHPICGTVHKDIGDHTGTCNAVTWMAWNGTDEISYDADTNTAYVYLTGDVTRDDSLDIDGGYTLYLCLNGKSLINSDDSDNNPVIRVADNAKFILCNCKDGGTITHSDGVLGKGVRVGEGGNAAVFIMYGGKISGNHTDDNCWGAGGAGVETQSGTIKMYGGTISDNVEDGSSYSGGGVCAQSGGKFIMYGGTIRDNTAKKGGGVTVWGGGQVTISGGTISGNKAVGRGGGIYTNGTLTISGNSVIESNEAEYGGGVFYYGTYYSMTISDSAKIAGNTATGNGGGICFENGGTLTIKGGSITGNTAVDNGGGVYFGGDIFIISGNIDISGNKKESADNNVYLPTGKYITIAGELTGSKIGVTTEAAPSSTSYVRIASSSNKNYADPEKFQYENDGTLSVSAVGNSSINLVVCKHSLSSDWRVDTSNHWHNCSICNAKIGVTAHTYDQEVVSETYKKSDATCTSKAIYYMSCVCGMNGTETFESGDKNLDNHSGTLGDWKSDDNGHWKEYSCCGAHAETAAHTPGPAATEDAPQTCTECGYELAPALEHTHAWGGWTSNGDGTHSRICSKDPSHIQKDNCSGGTATCQTPAICDNCSKPYGEKDMTNHAGGTEVRGRVEATTTSEGYTGDTYCKGCNTKISDGTTIPKIDSGSGSGNSTNTGNGSGTAGNTPSAPVTAPAAEETAPSYDLYIVQKGDTLIKLARRYGCTAAEIVAANSDLIEDPHWIYPGWELRIPQDKATGTEPQDETTTTENKKIDVYIVKKGDTLIKLARKYGCTVAEIVAANSGLIKDPHWIYPGWELRIPLN